jgi:hypothetical protein
MITNEQLTAMTRSNCVSPILGRMGRGLNDRLPNGLRQLLVPLIQQLPGTAYSDESTEKRRGYMALNWFIRVYTPAWLDLAGLRENADELRTFPEIVDSVSARRAEPLLLRSRENAAAARTTAWAAARTTPGAAAWDAARASVTGAVSAILAAAAGDAAWDATWGVAGAEVGFDAGAAAWDAASAAAWSAARDAVVDGVAPAAEAAAADVLVSTAAVLQRSVIDLYSRMVKG